MLVGREQRRAYTALSEVKILEPVSNCVLTALRGSRQQSSALIAVGSTMDLGRQERRAYRMLWNVATLAEPQVAEVVRWVLQAKVCPPHAWYNLLLYTLEREPSPSGRRNVVTIISRVVLGEKSSGSTGPFTKLVKRGIAAISHATDGAHTNQVRLYLHHCMLQWIQRGIVSARFLKTLEQAEGKWTFSGARPKHSHAASPEAPPTFDLVRLGQKGPGYDANLDMGALVRRGMAQGIQEGWLSVDRDGHHVVHVK